MKRIPTIMATVVLSALATIASAQQPITIYIAGANADRATTNTAIPKLLTGTVTFAGTNSDPTRANYGVFTGGSFQGVPVTIKTSYLGATAGIAGVAGQLSLPFVPDGVTGGSVPDPTVGNNPKETAIPDIAMSSQSQASSVFIGNYQGREYENLKPQERIVSVLGFSFVASPGFPSDTITSQQARVLFTNGEAPLALFTNNPADQNKKVFAVGRNLDSGARYVTQGETGVGIFSISKHWQPVLSQPLQGTVTSHVLWPRETVSGVDSLFPGNSGFNTGSALANALTATLSPAAYQANQNPNLPANTNITGGFYIGYLSSQDTANISVPNGAVALKFNGVPYSENAIREGRYTLWSYEHLYYSNALAAQKKLFAEALATQIRDVDAAVSGIFINTMKVERAIEGGDVTPTY
jgi:hypothetical protein